MVQKARIHLVLKRNLPLIEFRRVALGLGLFLAYFLLSRSLNSNGLITEIVDPWIGAGTPRMWAFGGFFSILVVALLTPFSSAVLLVLLGTNIFGGAPVFAIGLAAGVTSASLSYWMGRLLSGFVLRSGLGDRVEEARDRLTSGDARLWFLVALVKAVPNPLYDVWGYAAGALRLPFLTYLTASTAGGAVPLGILCLVY